MGNTTQDHRGTPMRQGPFLSLSFTSPVSPRPSGATWVPSDSRTEVREGDGVSRRPVEEGKGPRAWDRLPFLLLPQNSGPKVRGNKEVISLRGTFGIGRVVLVNPLYPSSSGGRWEDPRRPTEQDPTLPSTQIDNQAPNTHRGQARLALQL